MNQKLNFIYHSSEKKKTHSGQEVTLKKKKMLAVITAGKYHCVEKL